MRLLRFCDSVFSPAKLAGLKVWMDATDFATLTFNSTTISQWNDKSGCANHATEGTATRQPKYVASAIHGRPALEGRHDGVNLSQLTIADNATLDYSQFTAFSVAKRNVDTGGNEYIAAKFNPGTNNREYGQIVTSTDTAGCIISSTGAVSVGTAAVASPLVDTTTPVIVESVLESTTLTQRLSGGNTGTLSVPSGVFNGTAAYKLFSITSGATPVQEGFVGYLGEHLFFTRALTQNERNMVIAYLKSKWSIA